MKIGHFRSFEPVRKKISWKRWLAFLLSIICVGSIIYVCNLDGYQIKSVAINGAVHTDEDKARTIAEQSISGKYFFVIPKTFIWLYPKSEIKKLIKSLLPVLDADVKVNRDSDVLIITIKELVPKYLWCNDKSECYYMDERGFVFSRAPLLEGSVFVSFSGFIDKDPLGQYFLPKTQMLDLIAFMDALKGIALTIRAVRAISISEIYINLQSGSDLIISLEKPLDDVLENLKILKYSPDFTSASGGIDKTKYIDLRYGAKAFWR